MQPSSDNTSGMAPTGSPTSMQEAGCTHPSECIVPTTDTPTPQNSSPGQDAGDARSSLDTLETSVSVNAFNQWMSAKPASTEGELRAVIGKPTLAEKFRHSGWWKQRGRIFEALIRTKQKDHRIINFASCGRNAWLERADLDQSRVRIKQNCCHDRLCLPCANAKAFRVKMALKSMMARPHLKFITLTLTGKNHTLVEMVDRLYRHFRALRQHPTWDDKISGGAAFLEIKWNDKAHRWHPHLHIIAEGKFLPQAELSDAWRSISKDSFIVWVKPVTNTEVDASYVTKYASKPLNPSFINDDAKLDEAINALRGRRLCLCFGTWYGTPLDIAEDEELANDEIDAGGWSSYMPLEDALHQAQSGDPYYVKLLMTAGCEHLWRRSLLMDSS